MTDAQKIDKAVRWIIAEAKKEGIVVMRYDAITTNSTYLKLDDGVLGTLRVSDHKGRDKLKYKYNLTLGSVREQRYENSTVQVFAPFQDIELLWQRILSDRQELAYKYGDRYKQFMDKNRGQNKGKAGFWSKAKYVQKKWRLDK